MGWKCFFSFFSRVLHRTQVHFYLNFHLYLDCDAVLLHTNDICILWGRNICILWGRNICIFWGRNIWRVGDQWWVGGGQESERASLETNHQWSLAAARPLADECYNSCCLFGNCWSKIPLNLAIGTMEFETNLNFAFFVKSFGFDLLSKLSWEFALRNAFKGFWLTAQTLLASRHSTFPDISVTDKMYVYKMYRIESVSKTIITRKS